MSQPPSPPPPEHTPDCNFQPPKQSVKDQSRKGGSPENPTMVIWKWGTQETLLKLMHTSWVLSRIHPCEVSYREWEELRPDRGPEGRESPVGKKGMGKR